MIPSSDKHGLNLVVGAFCALFVVAGAPALGGPAFVLRDGRKVGLEESTTELAVILVSSDASQGFKERMAAAGLEVADYNDRPDSLVKIVTVPSIDAAQKELLAADPAVTEVQRVLRLNGVEVPSITTGVVVAKIAEGQSAAQRNAAWAEHGFAVVRAMEDMPNVYLLRPTEQGADEVALAEGLADDPRTEWAHPNLRHPLQTQQVEILDEFFRQQWHHDNHEQRGGTEDADIDTPEAWEITEGEGVLFGAFDTGTDVDHEDLAAGYIGVGQDPFIPRGRPGSDDPRPKERGDTHGTAVMGLMVARGNEVGGRGVAPRARFTVTRGISFALSFADVASAYLFALRQNVDVHNNSWSYGLYPNPPVIEEAIGILSRSGRNRGDINGDGTQDRLGTVIMFSAGNADSFNYEDYSLATIPGVVEVGATDNADRRVDIPGWWGSNFSDTLSVVAPGVDIFTCDNTDRPGAVDPGYNIDGYNPYWGEFETDTSGKYTDFFGGTSAASPIAAGVAGLVLSVNPDLAATDVRLILEHTADQVQPADADYDRVTSHSLYYGYGRVNARRAVEAAQLSVEDDGAVWPDAVMDVRVSLRQVRFQQTINTDGFLVLESDTPIAFIPEDGVCYAAGQTGCETTRTLPANVRVLAAGCGLTCGEEQTAACDCGEQQCVSFTPPQVGRRYFAIYAHNSAGLYSWGVAADTNLNTRGEARLLNEQHPSCRNASAAGPPVGSTTEPPPPGPAVTITASPLSGNSPLTVTFQGNAVSETPIDESATEWDFDISDGVAVDGTSRSDTHTYEVDAGLTKTFVARLTMADTDGRTGSAQVGITVKGAVVEQSGGVAGPVQIVASLPGSPGSNISQGTAPFAVMLTIDATELTAGINVQSISVTWDLGDGNRAAGLSVLHTYLNESDTAIRVPVSATVVVTSTGGTTSTATASKLLTINPGAALPDLTDPVLPGAGARGAGGTATPCGAMGLIPFAGLISGLWLFRRRRQ